MTNPIVKEIAVLELTSKDYLTDEALAEFATTYYDVEGLALIRFIQLYYSELYDAPEELTALIVEDNADGYTMRAMLEEFGDSYYGSFDSVEDFAADFFETVFAGKEMFMFENAGILNCIDWERYWTSTLQFDYCFFGNYFFRNI
jgi:hypothetical protein